MKHDEIAVLIIKRLGEGNNPDELLFELCQKTGYSWRQAELLVKQVQEENDAEIARKQLPVLFGLAFITFFGGVVLTSYGLYALGSALLGHSDLFLRDLTSYFIPVLEKGIDPLSGFKSLLFPYLNMILGFLVSPFSAIFFGLAMLFGSMHGMRFVWLKILKKK
jgi:hypothetical protein